MQLLIFGFGLEIGHAFDDTRFRAPYEQIMRMIFENKKYNDFCLHCSLTHIRSR